MDNKSNGLEILKSIKNITNMIRRLQEEIDTTYAAVTNITQKIKDVNVQSSMSGDSMGDKIAEIIEYQNQIEEYQNELCKKKAIVLETLKSMKIEDQQILLLRYFRGMSIEAMATEMEWSYYWTWQQVHKAEEKFCKNFRPS